MPSVRRWQQHILQETQQFLPEAQVPSVLAHPIPTDRARLVHALAQMRKGPCRYSLCTLWPDRLKQQLQITLQQNEQHWRRRDGSPMDARGLEAMLVSGVLVKVREAESLQARTILNTRHH
ncbi:MAG: hypothetical protein MHM6MM_009480 [Cercozoa sp. M6MM]